MVSKRKRQVSEAEIGDEDENKLKQSKGVVASKRKKKAESEKINVEIKNIDKNDEQKAEATNKNNDLLRYSKDDMTKLLTRLDQAIPAQDNLRFTSRLDKINWEEVAFDDYSAVQCREMWESIEKHVRRYRLLREIVDDAKEWVHSPWKNFKSVKNSRHPDMPRRPLTSYMIYYLKYKDRVMKDKPGTDITTLSKQIAEMYKTLPPVKKEKYVKLAAENRKNYDDKMEEFYRNHPELVPISKKEKKEKDGKLAADVGPKKPCTPFKCFYEDKLKAADPNVDKNALLETCKEQWKAMTDQKKVVWIDIALDQDNKYQNQVKAYASENPAFAQIAPSKNILTKEEISLKERMAGKPEKPPNSAYSLFSRIMLVSDSLKTVKAKERMVMISKQWKDCTPEMKNEYKERVAHMMEQYKLEYASYLESLPKEKREEELLKSMPKKKRDEDSVKGAAKKRNPAKAKAMVPVTVESALSPKKIETGRNVSTDEEETFTVQPPKIVYEGEPVQPPCTPFLLFAQKTVKLKPLKKTVLEEMWSKLTPEEKMHYRKKLNDLKQKYIGNYEKFLKGLSQDQLREYSRLKAPVKQSTGDGSKNSDSESESDNEGDSECTSESSSGSEQEESSEEDV